MTEETRPRRRILSWAGFAGILSALRLPLPAFALGQDRTSDSIAGSWIVTIDYSSSPDRTRGLATFTSDGGFVGSITGFEAPPARPTPSRGTTLHGAWRPAGHRQYALTAVRLHLDQRGVLLGTMKTRSHLTLDTPDRWSGTFTFDVLDTSGTFVRSSGGRLEATRIEPF